jgi:hypothetical protein
MLDYIASSIVKEVLILDARFSMSYSESVRTTIEYPESSIEKRAYQHSVLLQAAASLPLIQVWMI